MTTILHFQRDEPEVDDFYLSDQLYHDPNSAKDGDKKANKSSGVCFSKKASSISLMLPRR